jgi:hypothetical protein
MIHMPTVPGVGGVGGGRMLGMHEDRGRRTGWGRVMSLIVLSRLVSGMVMLGMVMLSVIVPGMGGLFGSVRVVGSVVVVARRG